MRLLANLDWYRIETKKPKSVSKTPLTSIDRQVISVSDWHRWSSDTSGESLETRFCDHLADDRDILDSVCRKIDLLLHSFDMSSYDGLGDDQQFISSDPDSHLSLLSPEQHSVASKMIKAVLHETHRLMFLQGSAGTRKTFIIKALINALQSHRKKCLICGTTGIAAVQYLGGTTFHSLLRLGIDEPSRGGFRSNIGCGTPLARNI
jgi:hypothetical protein